MSIKHLLLWWKSRRGGWAPTIRSRSQPEKKYLLIFKDFYSDFVISNMVLLSNGNSCERMKDIGIFREKKKTAIFDSSRSNQMHQTDQLTDIASDVHTYT